MPKYVIKEGVVEKFLTFFFKAAVNKKNRMIKKALKTDPELAKRMERVKETSADLAEYLQTRKDLDY
tara:strand:- start:1894 stop:2094 length:201 start_codon:yes stop_codon:yes gene_type:complete